MHTAKEVFQCFLTMRQLGIKSCEIKTEDFSNIFSPMKEHCVFTDAPNKNDCAEIYGIKIKILKTTNCKL